MGGQDEPGISPVELPCAFRRPLLRHPRRNLRKPSGDRRQRIGLFPSANKCSNIASICSSRLEWDKFSFAEQIRMIAAKTDGFPDQIELDASIAPVFAKMMQGLDGPSMGNAIERGRSFIKVDGAAVVGIDQPQVP